jgi:hypothetical protein
MLKARSHADLDKLKKQIGDVRRISDRLIGIGPFGIGLDGLSAWLPIGGEVYTLAAGGLLLSQAWRVHASKATLSKMAGLLAVDAATDAVPIPFIAPLVDMAFTGHKWAANLLLKEMEQTLYVEASEDEVMSQARHGDLARRIRSGQERRRVVFLGGASAQAPAQPKADLYVAR